MIADDAVLDLLAGHDAVLARLRAGHLLERDHGIAAPLVEPHHLADARLVGVHDVVAEHDRERLVADEIPGLQDGVAEPQRLLLADVGDRHQLRDLADLLEQVVLALLLEHPLQLEGGVEVVLDRVLAPPVTITMRSMPASRASSTTYWMRGRSTSGQHLLGLGLGGRQEAGSQAGGGEDGDANLGHRATV